MGAPVWAANSAQWIRTALTDLYHAVGQAEIGGNDQLVRRYRALTVALLKQETLLMKQYGVPPATGVGKRARKDKSA